MTESLFQFLRIWAAILAVLAVLAAICTSLWAVQHFFGDLVFFAVFLLAVTALLALGLSRTEDDGGW